MSKARSRRIDDIETIETELMLADLESLEKRIVPLEKKAKGGDKEAKELFDLMTRCLADVARGQAGAARRGEAGGDEELRRASAF